MAKKVQVLLVCDVHGDETPGDETVGFTFEGARYEIDLCTAHANDLRNALAPYVASAQRAGGRVSGRRGPRGRVPTVGGRQETIDIRAWARGQGMKISDRGRIPASIVEQYRAAH